MGASKVLFECLPVLEKAGMWAIKPVPGAREPHLEMGCSDMAVGRLFIGKAPAKAIIILGGGAPFCP